ncbi:MAG: hypothetical protein GY771_13640 [bacterium]|nr:hypothetical protein [bacterium]
MSVFTHVAIGAAVGVASGNPVLAFLLGIASHAVADTMSHFDFENVWLETALAIVAGFFLWWLGGWQWAVFFGALGAALPDMEHLMYHIKLFKNKADMFPSHGGTITHGREISPVNILFQAGLFGLFSAWVWAAGYIL